MSLALLWPLPARSSERPESGEFPRQVTTERGLRLWDFNAAGDSERRFSLVVLVEVGSRDEEADERGLAHPAEHCLFRSTTRLTTAELLAELRRGRVEYNAFTTQEWTGYFFDTPAERWRWLVTRVAEMLLYPAFSEDDVAAEVDIVLEELYGRGRHQVGETIESLLYDDHPLGRSVGGEPATVQRFDRDDVERFYRRHYRAGSTIVAWSHAAEPAASEAEVARAFRGLPAGSGGADRVPPEPRVGAQLLGGGTGAVAAQQSGFVIAGFHVSERSPEAMVALLVIDEMLDHDLFQELRTEQALAYTTDVGFVRFADAWRLQFQVQVSKRTKLRPIVEAFDRTVAELAQADGAGFEQARATVLGNLVADRGVALLSATVATWHLARAGDDAPDLHRRLRELDWDDVRATARLLRPDGRYLLTDDPSLTSPSPWLGLVALVVMVVVGVTVITGPRTWRDLAARAVASASRLATARRRRR